MKARGERILETVGEAASPSLACIGAASAVWLACVNSAVSDSRISGAEGWMGDGRLGCASYNEGRGVCVRRRMLGENEGLSVNEMSIKLCAVRMCWADSVRVVVGSDCDGGTGGWTVRKNEC